MSRGYPLFNLRVTQRYADRMVAVSEVRGTSSKFSSSDRTWTPGTERAGLRRSPPVNATRGQSSVV